MLNRRGFFETSGGWLAAAALASAQRATFAQQPATAQQPAAAQQPATAQPAANENAGTGLYRITRDVPTKRFDGQTCWAHPRCGIVPGAGLNGQPRVVMTLNTVDLVGSDVFRAVYGMRTDDLGRTWTEPREFPEQAPRRETINGVVRPIAVCDAWPRWHAASRKLLATGQTVVYTPEWRVADPRPRHTAYMVYDPERDAWSPWQKLEMPPDEKFYNSGAGCTQRFDLSDGTILLPFYFKPQGRSRVAVARCAFDGQTLRYLEHGDELFVEDTTRGLGEPSLTKFDGRFYLTIRHDQRGYVTHSRDGLHFEPIRPWTFDDGSDLGNYNTQQHWVNHSEALHLVYTRRGANNDHIFRHRAPLFIAQVDPQRLCVLRATERILIPQRGTRLGNFGVTEVSRDETWVTDSEWMQPRGVEQHGSDGSVYVARIHWTRPNANAGT